VNKIKIRGYIGIFMIVLMFAAFFAWENYGRDAFMYTKVVAFNTEIMKGDIIEATNLKTMNVEKDTINTGVTDANSIIGKVAMVDIPADMPLSDSFFYDVEDTTVDDTFIFSIPSSWIYGVPQSIRAQDTAYFYEVKADNTVDGIAVMENNTSKVEEDADFLFSARIKYVKDGSNREVVNTSRGSRDDGSSNVQNIEIIGTKEELEILETKAKNGSKFIIMYKE